MAISIPLLVETSEMHAVDMGYKNHTIHLQLLSVRRPSASTGRANGAPFALYRFHKNTR